MKIIRFIAAMFLLLLTPVHAETSLGAGIPLGGDEPLPLSPQEAAKRKKAYDAYKATLKTIPDAGPADPWGGVRDPAPAAKPKTRSKPASKGAIR